jgi:Tol biopolymer transport system component
MTQIGIPGRARQATVLLTAAAVVALLLVVLFGTKPAGATFPGTNGKIAFVKGNPGGDYGNIYIMNANGSGVSKLTSSGTATGPTFSKSGTKLAFSQEVNGGQELYTMRPDGSAKTRLTNNADTDDFPAFSPDGTKIAFKSNRGGNGVNETGDPDNEIWVMKAAPENDTDIGPANRPVRLTENAASDADPNWSPGGTKIVFASRRADPDGDIYIMNADGTAQKRLTTSSAGDFTPEFSPNGNKIVFRSSRDGDQEIYTMNIDGTGTKKLTNNNVIDYTPNWSPNGTKIVFAKGSTTSYSDHQIYTMNVDGTGTQKLTTDTLGDIYPAWQPLR